MVNVCPAVTGRSLIYRKAPPPPPFPYTVAVLVIAPPPPPTNTAEIELTLAGTVKVYDPTVP
jgi:hypothetical protein